MNRNGFTLIELAVAVVIVGILAALAIPRFFGMTSRVCLSEFVSVLKSLYVLQESRYSDVGHYTSLASDLGFQQPSGSPRFVYAPKDGLGGDHALGSASSLVSLKASQGTTIAPGLEVACVDVSGLQYGSVTGLGVLAAQNAARDVGLFDSNSVPRISGCQ